MHRRALLQSLVAGTGTALSATMFGSLAQVEQVRRELDRLLDGSDIGADTADHWEAVPGEYGQRFLMMAPDRLLREIAGDFIEIQHLLGSQHTTKERATLARSSGQLAVLAGQCMRNLGDMRSAQAWFVPRNWRPGRPKIERWQARPSCGLASSACGRVCRSEH